MCSWLSNSATTLCFATFWKNKLQNTTRAKRRRNENLFSSTRWFHCWELSWTDKQQHQSPNQVHHQHTLCMFVFKSIRDNHIWRLAILKAGAPGLELNLPHQQRFTGRENTYGFVVFPNESVPVWKCVLMRWCWLRDVKPMNAGPLCLTIVSFEHFPLLAQQNRAQKRVFREKLALETTHWPFRSVCDRYLLAAIVRYNEGSVNVDIWAFHLRS